MNLKIIAIAHQHDTFREVSGLFQGADAHFVGVTGLPKFTRDWTAWDVVLLFADGYPTERAARAAAGFDVQLVVVITAEVEAMRETLWTSAKRSRILVVPSAPASSWAVFEAVRRGLPMRRGSH